ncbi:MAG: SAM-dependent methyltransferase [Flavobacteriales bacterium]|nr:SAM-dependent methyltransferase [Flavobacteriales bacterium]
MYLQKLGVCEANGRVKDKQQDKFRQINRYVELMSHWFEKIDHSTKLNIVDMGSGKGYLTFALYDYLKNQLRINVSVTGVELRENLVDLCNEISLDCDFNDLQFISKDIRDFSAEEIDVIIALHACDTATDLAIYKGINANAKLIVCAPCCHKQVRKDMGSKSQFKALTKHGVFEERQAEMLTDTIRSLLMEREGFKTKVFEFISNEHTRKNVMMVGHNTNSKKNRAKINDEVKQLKDSFNIQRHELEDLLS